MLDSSINMEDYEKFILSYKKGTIYALDIDKNETTEKEGILIQYANGKEEIVEETPEKEKEILEKMKKQVRIAAQHINYFERARKRAHTLKFIEYSAVVASIGISVTNNCSTPFDVIFSGAISGLFSYYWFRNIRRENLVELIEKDIEKNKFFIDNESSFDDSITINDLDNYSLDQLKELLGKKLELK